MPGGGACLLPVPARVRLVSVWLSLAYLANARVQLHNLLFGANQHFFDLGGWRIACYAFVRREEDARGAIDAQLLR